MDNPDSALLANTGTARLGQVDIHLSPKVVTEWLEL
jgi:hypothetical protein